MKAFFTFFFLGIVLFASAQNTFKTRVFLSPDEGDLAQVIQLGDGSFVSIGYIDNSDGDIELVKMNAGGSVTATKSVSTAGYDEGYSIIKTSDGGFAVTGSLNDQTGLLKFKSDLTLEWQREYDISGGQSGTAQLVQTSDGGYLLSGAVSDASSNFAGSIVKTDGQGVIQFQKRYFSFSDSYIFDITPMKDGNYAFLAVSYGNSDKYYVGKIRPADGSLVWAKEFLDNSYALLQLDAILGTSDGGVVVSGYAEENGGNGNDWAAIAKFDNGGSLVWAKTLQNPDGGSEGYAIAEDKDGGYLFAGNGYDETNSIACVIKTSSAGVLQWTKTYEPDPQGYTIFADLTATSDGGYATCGTGYFLTADNVYNFGSFIYKFNSSFETCGETPGSAGGSLVDFGTTRTPALSPVDATLVSASSNATIADAEGDFNYVCSSGVLPLQLLSFNAILQNKSVNVSWATANEVNTDYFVVERSTNGVSFTALQTVAAKGGNGLTQSYSINDLQPLQGTSYYRLQQVDKDGKTTYSSVVAVTVMSNGTIVISPNPVQSNIRVVVQSTANSNLTLQVVNMQGNVLAVQTKAVTSGRNEINIPAASLAKGVYILKVMDKVSVQTIRFVKE